MTNQISQNQTAATGQVKDSKPANFRDADVSSFRRAINSASHSKEQIKDQEKPDQEKEQPGQYPPQLAMARNPEKGMLQQNLENEGNTSLQLSGNSLLNAQSTTPASVDSTHATVNLEQFSLLLDRILQPHSEVGRQWLFNLQDASLPINKLTLVQTTAGQWTLSMSASSKADEQILSKHLEKLLQRVRATGQVVEMIYLDREK